MEETHSTHFVRPAGERRRNELGAFLRSRREKLSLEDVGLSSGARRRTPGLRREEVAELAKIGVDWYTRLEQGRTVTPSAATIDALARALRLSQAEHTHLRTLTRNIDRPVYSRESVPASIRSIVDSLTQPAYVTGRRWDVLVWNTAASEVFVNFGQQPEEDRNILLYMLTNRDCRGLFGAAWEEEARRMLAEFRTTYDLWAAEPAFIDLIARLRKGCPEFNAWWESHEVRDGIGVGVKRLTHPKKGLLHFEYASFLATDDPALKLVIYTPVSLLPPTLHAPALSGSLAYDF